METPYLIVQVSDRPCALPLARGMEVLRLPQMRSEGVEVPALLGFAEIRGRLTPVFALRVLLGLPATLSGLRKVVCVELAGGPAALAVEHVLGVHRLAPGQVETILLPGSGERQLGRFELGFARLVERGGLVPDATWQEIKLARAEAGA